MFDDAWMDIEDAISKEQANFGSMLDRGTFSAVYEGSKKELVTYVTTETPKPIYLKKLFEIEGLSVGDIKQEGILSYLEVPRLDPVDMNLQLHNALVHVTEVFDERDFSVFEEYESIGSPVQAFEEYFSENNLPMGRLENKVRDAISTAFFTLRETRGLDCFVHIDLHWGQFGYTEEGKILCIDPVIFI